jgi:RNA polymerase sigma-70 factor (ECF subfamily)
MGITREPVLVNGGPGIITHDSQGKVVSVLSLEVLGGVVQTVRGIVNPDKLQHLGAVSDLLRIRHHPEQQLWSVSG